MENQIGSYDKLIHKHYKNEAEVHGLEPTSTMLDKHIRESETNAIIELVKLKIQQVSNDDKAPIVIADIGCGNGHTLDVVSKMFPHVMFLGFDKTPEFLELAEQRFIDRPNVFIQKGDIRERGFTAPSSVDVIISQRVLINILDESDQKLALDNIIRAMRNISSDRCAGSGIFIESFKRPLEALNHARKQHDLEEIASQYHNLYLDENFFDIPSLQRLHFEQESLQENLFSTHYFLGRVIYPLFRSDKSISRNSDLVDFFRMAISRNVGDYSPLKIFCYDKI